MQLWIFPHAFFLVEDNETNQILQCFFTYFKIVAFRFHRGVGAMEIVAVDMKLRGMYIARQLSFQGVTFRIEEVPLSEEFIQMYDDSVDLVNWFFPFYSNLIYSLYWIEVDGPSL